MLSGRIDRGARRTGETTWQRDKNAAIAKRKSRNPPRRNRPSSPARPSPPRRPRSHDRPAPSPVSGFASGPRAETEIRRLLHDVHADQAALQARQEELETFMVAAAAMTWPEAAAKARYLIRLYAATQDAQDPRRQQLIAGVLADLARLSE